MSLSRRCLSNLDAAATVATVATVAILLLPVRSDAQAILKAGDSTFIRFGVSLQAWADFQEMPDATGTVKNGTQQNLFLRRARLMMVGQVVEDLSFYLQLDSSNLGKNKAAGAPFAPAVSVLDAFGLWRLSPSFQLQGGLFYVPFSRATLTGSRSFLTLDANPGAFIASAPTESISMRDTGFGAMGFLFGDRLQYRTGVYQGQRPPGSQASFRYAGRVQYEFFDAETGYLYQGYVYPGTNLGKKKILAVGVGSDNQGDYHAYSADVFADLPVGKGDAVTANASWFHYDGETRLPTFPRQNDYVLEAGYYVSSIRTQPFLQYFRQSFSDEASQANNLRKYQAGLNYYVSGQNLKLTAAYTRFVPDLASKVATNQFTIQLQVGYF